MLSIAQVAAFVAVVDSRSFQEAAKRLGTAQPTVSQNLKNLEETLGVSLLNRIRGRSEPTKEGVAFLPYARALLTAAEQALQFAHPKTLSIGASSNIGTYLLSPVLTRFVRNEPELKVNVQIGPNPAIIESLEAGTADVVLTEWWNDRPGYAARPWMRERVVVIVPPGHPWEARRRINVKDLFDVQMIGGEPGTGTATLLQQAFGENADKIKVTYKLGSTEAVKSAVKAGLGVSLVMSSAVADDVAAGRLIELPIANKRLEKQLMIIHRSEIPNTAPAARFVAMVLGTGENQSVSAVS